MKQALEAFTPGAVWPDTDSRPIQAHGGGVLYDSGIYYWFGENKGAENARNQSGFLERVDVIGVSCYSSTDLYNWKHEGVVLSAQSEDPGHDLHPSKVVERPKVLFNAKTGKYVMWMHIDTCDYKTARVGIAVSDKAAGPYEYLGSFKPNDSDSRDMTVFQDEDGRAYLFHSSEDNSTMHIVELTEDYLSVKEDSARNFIGCWREAPAVFKHNNKYFCIPSGCTGWAPNEAEVATADNIMGPWETKGNPCIGANAHKTFYAQSTFVLPVQGREGTFIFMADRWQKENLQDSRYVWLPIDFDGESISIDWIDSWDLSYFDME